MHTFITETTIQIWSTVLDAGEFCSMCRTLFFQGNQLQGTHDAHGV